MGKPHMKGIDTMMKKLTKKEMFIQIKSRLTDQDEIAFINHEIELLNSKNSGSRKPTATQQENEKFKIEIVEFLDANHEGKFTISEIQQSHGSLKELSNQRISAILKQLVDAKQITKVYEKRKAYFTAGD